jgi:hypothetical protein
LLAAEPCFGSIFKRSKRELSTDKRRKDKGFSFSVKTIKHFYCTKQSKTAQASKAQSKESKPVTHSRKQF